MSHPWICITFARFLTYAHVFLDTLRQALANPKYDLVACILKSRKQVSLLPVSQLVDRPLPKRNSVLWYGLRILTFHFVFASSPAASFWTLRSSSSLARACHKCNVTGCPLGAQLFWTKMYPWAWQNAHDQIWVWAFQSYVMKLFNDIDTKCDDAIIPCALVDLCPCQSFVAKISCNQQCWRLWLILPCRSSPANFLQTPCLLHTNSTLQYWFDSSARNLRTQKCRITSQYILCATRVRKFDSPISWILNHTHRKQNQSSLHRDCVKNMSVLIKTFSQKLLRTKEATKR